MSTIYLLTEWTLKASGLFEADSVFLVKKDACAVSKDITFHLEGEIGHAPKCVPCGRVEAGSDNKILPCF